MKFLKNSIKLNFVIQFLLIFISSFCYSQIYEIYTADTMYFQKEGILGIELKDTLPDGTYFVFELKKVNNKKNDTIKEIREIAHFKNFVKHGTIMIYEFDNKTNNSRMVLLINYKNGIKDGFYFLDYSEESYIESGSYSEGIREGLWERVYIQENKRFILNYKNGKVIFYNEYEKNGILIKQVFGCPNFLNGLIN